jgi:hypothetical protein
VPLQAAPVVPPPLIEQPVAVPAPVETVIPTEREAKTTPVIGPRRSAARVPPAPKAAVRTERRQAAPAASNRSRPMREREAKVGAPLSILPPAARIAPPPVEPQERAIAFAPERQTTFPWPFREPRSEPRFDVPGGLW